MDALALCQRLQQGEPLQPVYVLYGEEPVLMTRCVEALRSRLADDAGPPAVLRFDFEEDGCSGAVMACSSVPLFGAADLVVLTRCTAFAASSGKQKGDTSSLEAYLAAPNPGRVFVIQVPASKLDERKRLTRLIKPYPQVACQVPKPEVARHWLQVFAQERGIAVTADALAELWRRRPSLSVANTELDKLWTYTGGRTITAADVAEVVSAPLEDNVFAWIDGVVSGRVEQALAAVADLYATGQDPLAMLALIARQLRLMWYARAEGGRVAWADLAARIGAHPYALRVAGRQARHLPLAALETLLTLVADAEYWVKTGRRDVKHALEAVVLRCAAAVHFHGADDFHGVQGAYECR
ncbi:hypothetical protein GCM10010885_24400 [Alicyclobacillus cellulosilyticus]|uniref:DNA polymerase III subunit delta n=1 Tax=Alicyclobacillus cellulosilyticus TaxID=1003997 RepID=A0A917KJ24_9BACL|nr:DNA polymerase III subunit delta [Alicyclobacillus cellulosilyticus]GGJ14189.1 hypothetical protein GCM10010885_24400 [Alicyclobacillus cellulosilyticus]